MNLDRIIHKQKNFVEFTDADIETFLIARNFKTEHLNLEFKGEFPRKTNGKFDIKKICKYIVGFSNEEGGLIVYGVADTIKNPAISFPDYVPGNTHMPSLEDLSGWVKDRIYPLIASPAIRMFKVAGKNVAILKIPSGINKPYCYHDPQERTIAYFKKTPGGITELTPDTIREFHRTHLIDQATRMLQAFEFQGETGRVGPKRFKKHEDFVLPNLEDTKNFGWLRIYSHPIEPVTISVKDVTEFLERHRFNLPRSYATLPRLRSFRMAFPSAIFRQPFAKTSRAPIA